MSDVDKMAKQLIQNDLTKENYTAEEVAEIIAHRLTQHQISELQRNQGAMADEIKRSAADLKACVQGLERSLANNHTQALQRTSECRDELRKEIERDFATETDFKLLKQHIDTLATKAELNLLSIKLSLVIGGLMVVVQIVAPYILKALTHG